MERRKMWTETMTLALGIAVLPPLWAVAAPYIGVTTGAVALICAGLFVTNGNKYKDAFKICIGFLCGDLWAVVALVIMDSLNWNPDLELYIILFAMGGLAVLVGTWLKKWIFSVLLRIISAR